MSNDVDGDVLSQDSDAIRSKIRSIVAQHFDMAESDVKDDATFEDDFKADSLDRAELLLEFNSEFGVEIEEEDAEKLTTIDKIVEYFDNLKKNKS